MPSNKYKKAWDVLIIVLLIYTAIYVPYKVCFLDTTSDFQFIFDLMVDACFLTDIVFNFMTAFEEEGGMLIYDKTTIAKNYLKGWFSIDLMTSIPFQIFEKIQFSDDSLSQTD